MSSSVGDFTTEKKKNAKYPGNRYPHYYEQIADRSERLPAI